MKNIKLPDIARMISRCDTNINMSGITMKRFENDALTKEALQDRIRRFQMLRLRLKISYFKLKEHEHANA